MSRTPAHALPVIDLAPFLRGDAAGRSDVAAALAAACTDLGCFYLAGHGIARARLAGVLDAARALFALPDEAKRAVARQGGPGARGYARLADAGGEAKEEYYFGRACTDGEANRWPAALPGFAPRMLGHVDALHRVAARLMAAMAASLALPEDHFAAFCTDPIAALRLVRYPPGAGAGAHTDFGSLTLLLQDEVGGLQVRARDGGWIDVPPVAGTLVVNVGDLFERWTNGRYRSTPHRVVATPGVARVSAPFFLTGAADHEIACLPSCLAPGETARHAPTTVAAHLRARFAAQGY